MFFFENRIDIYNKLFDKIIKAYDKYYIQLHRNHIFDIVENLRGQFSDEIEILW